jgi:uncharacterized membrane-anchored protein
LSRNPDSRFDFEARTCVKNKVPQITLAFWVIKIAATTLGETGGDALSGNQRTMIFGG